MGIGVRNGLVASVPEGPRLRTEMLLHSRRAKQFNPGAPSRQDCASESCNQLNSDLGLAPVRMHPARPSGFQTILTSLTRNPCGPNICGNVTTVLNPRQGARSLSDS